MIGRAARAVTAALAASTLALGACTVDGAPRRAADVAATTADASGDTTFRIHAGTTPKVVVTVIEDLACPACALFESRFGSTLDAYAADPDVAVDYLVISFLDRMSADDYSSRAANASHCVWNNPDDQARQQSIWRGFQHAAFRVQPDEGGAGLPDDRLVRLADQAGATKAASCITGRQLATQVKRTTSTVTDDSRFAGTPTVRIDDADYTLSSPEALRAAIDEAKRR
ncbi:hypothetical protein nbrc107696_03320 [Gordonia spumicola]|uniref:Thioredoxin-like fold domain-containing protein n=1 Tax=Gordonia spumicola TaxID=589161 RepID=A0A7I9V398_9ACTN|nr:thioredoxin domain-containing protein [Gordonia spumicola]GED99885.1 hypothetical protein nbrc107696_03320 [Gordonia spumicola]